MDEKVVEKAINNVRAISAEIISNANSGHSGIALGAAPIVYAAYSLMNIDPAHPDFFNRDRFVMSAGHGSALLYTMLHFFGFSIGMDDLKQFRQPGSKTPGHTEVNVTPGVDCSTGPLGQGIATAVGIALAEKKLSSVFNREHLSVVDHYTFCLVGDGCLMEGVSYEACNLAGLWKLNKLVVLYDSNEVTLDGTRQSADGEDVRGRFEAMGWNVLQVANGNDAFAIMAAIEQAKRSSDKPTIVVVTTRIGFGAKAEGTAKAHGSVLSREECAELRRKLGVEGVPFEVCKDVKKHFERLSFKNLNSKKKWEEVLCRYRVEHPDQYREFCRFYSGGKHSFDVVAAGETLAPRDAGHSALQAIARQSVRVWGGCADVASTTKAFVEGGDNIAFGVREHAMGAISNGLALHGFTPYCSTFLAFSDFCKPSIRMTALMDLPVTYIFTHDGFGNSPDGPTHQANEHISALRLVPNLRVYRPADDVETAACFKRAFDEARPACIILGRGSVPSLQHGAGALSSCNIVFGSDKPSAVVVSTGSEVHLCVQAAELLKKSGIGVTVVSVPCFEEFDATMLPSGVPVIAVEVGRSCMWHRHADVVVGFDEFGESGPVEKIASKFGFTAENIAKVVLQSLR